MAIIGFNLSKVLAERKDIFPAKLEVSSKIDIIDIKKEKLEISKGKDVLKVDYSFLVLYNPNNLAKIEIMGHVLVMEDSKKVEEALKDWKKKKIDPLLRQQVYNTILRKCNLKALSLEEEMNIPTHFQMPQIRPENTEQQ